MFASNLVLSKIQGELKNIQFTCVGTKPFPVCTAISSFPGKVIYVLLFALYIELMDPKSSTAF